MKCIVMLSWLLLLLLFPLYGAIDSADYYAADQSLFIIPTAYTMYQGQNAFTDYELVILQYSHAISNRTHLSIMSPFPINSDMIKAFTFGFKQNYLRATPIEAAVWGSYTPHFHTMTLGNVFSVGSPHASGHLAVSWMSDLKECNSDVMFGAGGIVDLSKSIALIGEFLSTKEALKDGDGLFNLGIRFKGKKTTWDLGGMRPLNIDSEDNIFLLPFLKATFVF